MAEKFMLKTTVGDVEVSVWDADRVSVTAGERYGNSTPIPALYVNHINLECSGSWEFLRDVPAGEGWYGSHFTVKRQGGGWNGRRFVEAPHGGVSKVREAVKTALTLWSNSVEAANLLGNAGIEAIINEAEHLEREADRLEEEAAAKRRQAKAKRDEAAVAPKSIKFRAKPSFLSEEVEA